MQRDDYEAEPVASGSRPPRVVHLSAYDRIGGAGTMAYRIHNGLRRGGTPSQMVVTYAQQSDHDVYGPSGFFDHTVQAVKRGVDRRLLKALGNDPAVPFSPAWLPDRQLARIKGLEPDVIHLHWLGSSTIRLESLRSLGRYRPLVWTLHDSWLFTGGCHVPMSCARFIEGCGACPVLGSQRSRDLSSWIYRRKAATYRALNLHVVAPSAWIADLARSSPLLEGMPVSIVAHGIDAAVFKPIDKRLARSVLGWPDDRMYVLFGAVEAIDNPLKGVPYLLQALDRLAQTPSDRPIELAIFGSVEPRAGWSSPLPARFVGPVTDEIAMALVYAAADVMVVPSPYESFGLTAAEAQACGTPVVAFGASGLIDVVDHGRSGYLAEPYLPEDLAHGIDQVLQDAKSERRLPTAAAEHARRAFSQDRMVADYKRIYEKVHSLAK